MSGRNPPQKGTYQSSSFSTEDVESVFHGVAVQLDWDATRTTAESAYARAAARFVMLPNKKPPTPTSTLKDREELDRAIFYQLYKYGQAFPRRKPEGFEDRLAQLVSIMAPEEGA